MEMQPYETVAGENLPNDLKAKVVLKHARLSERQMQQVQTWLERRQNHSAVVEAITKLETDGDMFALLSGGTQTPSSLFEKTMTGAVWWGADPEEMEEFPKKESETEKAGINIPEAGDELYEEDLDVSEDLDEEDMIWIYIDDWCDGPIQESELSEQFVAFIEAKKWKQEKNKTRGWGNGSGHTEGKGGLMLKGGAGSKGKGGKGGKGGFGGKKGSGRSFFYPSTSSVPPGWAK